MLTPINKDIDGMMLTEIHSNGLSEKELACLISTQNNVVVLDYPMTSIGSSNSYLDIIQDYLEASYIVEELSKYAAKTDYEIILRKPNTELSRFKFVVQDVPAFAKKLYHLSVVFSYEENNAEINLVDELDIYADSLDNRKFSCPELVDGYYANLVNGAYYEMASEYNDDYMKKVYLRYPERKFGFWKSAYSQTIEKTFYVSSDCWIVPPDVDVHLLLEKYSGQPPASDYNEAVFFSIDNYSYLLSPDNFVYFPFGPYLNARKCLEFMKSGEDLYLKWLEQETLTFSSVRGFMREKYNVNAEDSNGSSRYLLSSSSSTLIIEDNKYRFVFFPDQVKANRAVTLYNRISNVFVGISNFAGVTSSVSLPWDMMDDEKFENLCYDVIYNNPRFDNETIRKMGKSRSRDGGRDIVVYSKNWLGFSRKKYIFQCKLTRKGTSLTTQKIGNISDTIVQYGAEGYGIMTNVVIDSGLYDRVDAICQKFNIDSDNWSVLEIERFVARHPKLRERHFKIGINIKPA